MYCTYLPLICDNKCDTHIIERTLHLCLFFNSHISIKAHTVLRPRMLHCTIRMYYKAIHDCLCVTNDVFIKVSTT